MDNSQRFSSDLVDFYDKYPRTVNWGLGIIFIVGVIVGAVIF